MTTLDRLFWSIGVVVSIVVIGSIFIAITEAISSRRADSDATYPRLRAVSDRGRVGPRNSSHAMRPAPSGVNGFSPSPKVASSSLFDGDAS